MNKETIQFNTSKTYLELKIGS